MSTKYFVDENDVEHWGQPLIGVGPDTKLYDSREEAETEAKKRSIGSVGYDVFETEYVKPFTEELKFDFPLTPSSLAIDAGAHEGQWSLEMWRRYRCQIIALEPIPRYIHETYLKLAGTTAEIIPLALGRDTIVTNFGVHGAMSGALADGPTQTVGMIGILNLLTLKRLAFVDVLKLNIESSEFEVLEAILDSHLEKVFGNIIVQPHPMVPDYEARWKSIDERLQQTHELVWHEPWCWSGYKLMA